MTDQVRISGLLPCCLRTISDLYDASPGHRAADGDMLCCRWCSAPVAFREGCWQRDLPWREGEEQR